MAECSCPQEFSTASDAWSYGVVLWEMFSLGAIPYPGMEPGMRLYEFLARGERMRCPERCPGYVYDIMLGCWQADPAARLSFDRIVSLLVREIRSVIFSAILVKILHMSMYCQDVRNLNKSCWPGCLRIPRGRCPTTLPLPPGWRRQQKTTRSTSRWRERKRRGEEEEEEEEASASASAANSESDRTVTSSP